MKLNKGAKIYTFDGKEIGSLSRVVLDPRSKNVTNIVFQHGLLNEEHVIPMRLVDHVDESGIHLMDVPVNAAKDFPKFLEAEFVMLNEQDAVDQVERGENPVDTYYYYPPLPVAGANARPGDLFISSTPGMTMGGTRVGVPVSGEPEPPVVKRTEENIPDGTVSLKEGSKVYSSDGKHIGNIERVYADSDSGKVSHLVISKGVLLKERKQIPADWISDISEDQVSLAVDSSFASRLPDYQEK